MSKIFLIKRENIFHISILSKLFLMQNSEKDVLFRQSLIDYFQDPLMYWIEDKCEKDEDENPCWSMFMCRLQSYLLNEYHFLIVLVPFSTVLSKNPRHLSTISFRHLQTRNLQEYEKYLHLPVHNYDPSQTLQLGKWKVVCQQSMWTHSEYKIENLPDIKLHLLHTRKVMNEYATRGTVVTALETFQCLLIWMEAPQELKQKNVFPRSSTFFNT